MPLFSFWTLGVWDQEKISVILEASRWSAFGPVANFLVEINRMAFTSRKAAQRWRAKVLYQGLCPNNWFLTTSRARAVTT